MLCVDAKVPLPFDTGFEALGIVEAVGAAVSKLKPGDAVVYMGEL